MAHRFNNINKSVKNDLYQKNIFGDIEYLINMDQDRFPCLNMDYIFLYSDTVEIVFGIRPRPPLEKH